MLRRLRRTSERIARRFFRPVVAFVLVLAQVVTAFGYPIVARDDVHVKACGCPVAGPDVSCCCEANTCCTAVAEVSPLPEPEPESCPKCKAKKAAEKPAPIVHWVSGMKARQCHGSGPLGLFADIPAVPPVIPTHLQLPTVVDRVEQVNQISAVSISVPLDPPPRFA
jgi:hypothetical protein